MKLRMTCRWRHRWTRWSPVLIERRKYGVTRIPYAWFRMCKRCGAHRERALDPYAMDRKATEVET